MHNSYDATDGDLMTKEQKRLTRDFSRGAPGDAAIFSSGKSAEQKELARRKSQYYGDAFAQRESNTSARERIHKESIVMADVRTNVIVNDEYTFITDLSYHLSSRYQRPESSILVTVTHSACLLLGGSFDPAYILTITALPSQVQPVTNKRNTVLLQKQMEESLRVPPSRGLVKFQAVSEDNFAFNGKTFAAEIEDLEREQGDDPTKIKRSDSRQGARTATKRQSMRSFRNLKAGITSGNTNSNPGEPLTPRSEHSARLSPPISEPDSLPPLPSDSIAVQTSTAPIQTFPVPEVPGEKSAMDMKAERAKKMGRRRSFISGFFGK